MSYKCMLILNYIKTKILIKNAKQNAGGSNKKKQMITVGQMVDMGTT